MKPVTCHLLSAVDILEPCPGDDCPFWDDSCLLAPLHSELPSNPALVQLLLGLREKLEMPGARPIVGRGPGFD
jgi:hypothetical protein